MEADITSFLQLGGAAIVGALTAWAGMRRTLAEAQKTLAVARKVGADARKVELSSESEAWTVLAGQMRTEIARLQGRLDEQHQTIEALRRTEVEYAELRGEYRVLKARLETLEEELKVASSRSDGRVQVEADDTGRIRDVAGDTVGLLGYREAELIGMSVHDLLPALVRDKHRADFAAAASRGLERSVAVNGDVLRRDGVTVPVVVSIERVKVPAGYRAAIIPRVALLPALK